MEGFKHLLCVEAEVTGVHQQQSLSTGNTTLSVQNRTKHLYVHTKCKSVQFETREKDSHRIMNARLHGRMRFTVLAMTDGRAVNAGDRKARIWRG